MLLLTLLRVGCQPRVSIRDMRRHCHGENKEEGHTRPHISLSIYADKRLFYCTIVVAKRDRVAVVTEKVHRRTNSDRGFGTAWQIGDTGGRLGSAEPQRIRSGATRNLAPEK